MNVFRKSIVATCALLTVGIGASQARPTGTLNHGTMIQLNNWNPLVKPNQTYTGIVFEGLLKQGPDGYALEPSLASSWKMSPTELELTLRSGVVFHDGTPFDAEAVKKNIEWIKGSGTQWAAGFATVSEIIVKDATHVVLKLSEPSPTLLQRLATRGAYMVSPKQIESKQWANAAGTGPWTYDAAASQLGTKEVFRYFDKYWAPEKVGVETIVMHVLQDPSVAMNALASGLVQATELESSQLPAAKAAGFTIKSIPTLVQHVLMLDRMDTFANENVRKAVCSAVDIQAVVDGGYNGYAKAVPQKFPAGQPGHNPALKGYRHDVAAAKKHMEAAGNPKISFQLPMYPGNQTMTLLIAQQLKQIGIDVKPQLMTTGQYFTFYQSDKYPLQINSSATENIGPLDYYQFRFGPKGVGNPFKVEVPELDALAQKALTVSDPEAQNKVWQEMTKVIEDKALDCGFYELHTTWAYDAKKLPVLPTTELRPSYIRYEDVKLAK